MTADLVSSEPAAQGCVALTAFKLEAVASGADAAGDTDLTTLLLSARLGLIRRGVRVF